MPRKKNPDDLKWVEQEFYQHAGSDGVLGDPLGEQAYAYLRVSSSGQAEEGRSGLPRQIEHVAEKAYQEGLYIPWDMVFFDDSTGFTFEDRENLNLLLDEIRSAPQSNKLVMEYPDRLSRDHTWRYGYLREQFNNYGIEFVYWKGYGSEVERSVIGAISEQGMRNELARMHEGTLHKARSGRVTAKTPAYGYEFVDSQGKPRTDPTSKWRKETYYIIHPPENEIMVRIFEVLAYQGATLNQLGNQLDAEGVPPPKTSSEWDPTLISKLIKNPVYKGEFVAHRYYYKKVRSKRTGKIVTRKFQRPEEEWIKVPVPPTVSEKTWQLANEAVKKNRTVAKRNLRYDALLVNYLKCSFCGHAYIYYGKKVNKNGRTYLVACYRCASNYRTKKARERFGCNQSQIAARRLDQVVWNVICKILLEPELLTEAMDRYYIEQGMANIHQQIDYMIQQLEDCDREDDKLYKAYLAEVFDEQEFAAKRKLLKERKSNLEEEQRKLQGMLISREEFEEKKRQILALSEQVRMGTRELDLPFEDKRRLLRLLVDEVQLDVNNGQFTLLGALKGSYPLKSDTFASIPADRGSCCQPE